MFRKTGSVTFLLGSILAAVFAVSGSFPFGERDKRQTSIESLNVPSQENGEHMILRLKRGSKPEGKYDTEVKKMEKDEKFWEARNAQMKAKFLALKKRCPQVKVDMTELVNAIKKSGRMRRSSEGDEAKENQATLNLASKFTRVKRDVAAKLQKRREEHQKKIKNLKVKANIEVMKIKQVEKRCKLPGKSASRKRARRSILRNGQESLVGEKDRKEVNINDIQNVKQMSLRVKRESVSEETYEKEKKKMKSTEDMFKGLLAQRKKLYLELRKKCPKGRRRRRSFETPDTMYSIKEDVVNKNDIRNATELYEKSLREKIDELRRQIATVNNSCESLHRVKRETENYKAKLAKLQAEHKKNVKMIKLQGSIVNMKIRHFKKLCSPGGGKASLKGVSGGTTPQKVMPGRRVPPRTVGQRRVPQRRVGQKEQKSQKRGKRSMPRDGQEEGMHTKDSYANSTKRKEIRETSDNKSVREIEENPEIQRLEEVQKSLQQELKETKEKCA